MADYHDRVSNLPISSKYRSLPDKPINESEREDFAARLNEEFARGTIGQDDYRRLLDTVFAARTNGDLLPVAEKLPARQTYDQPGIVAQPTATPPGELAPTRSAGQLGLWAMGGISVAAVVAILLVALVML